MVTTLTGKPVAMVARRPGSRFSLSIFFRSILYSTMAALKIGMDILAEEKVSIDILTGHGGLFKPPVAGQKYLAAACNALSPAWTPLEGKTLEEYLNSHVFNVASGSTLEPEPKDAAGFDAYIRSYKKLLEVGRKAVALI